MIIAVFQLGRQAAQAIAGDVDHFVSDSKYLARVFVFGVFEPGIESVQGFSVK
jgi:hypothetical protein